MSDDSDAAHDDVTRWRAQQRRAEETQQILVAATRRLLTCTAPEGITIRAIGAGAGVQFSVVNRYFGTKDALIRRAAEATMADWVVAMIDGPADTLVDRAIDYLAGSLIHIGTIRSAIADEGSFPQNRFPVLDAVVDVYERAGRPVKRINVITALSLITGWASAEGRWIQASGMPAAAARAVIVRQARRCLHDSFGA